VPYLIDTNIFIYARDGVESVLAKFEQHAGLVAISALSLAELQRGIQPPHLAPSLRLERYRALIDRIIVHDFNAAAARAYGSIIAAIGRVKSRDIDHMIAAHALSTGSTFVTDNAADFTGIPGLVLENWLAP
jgi:tRNA(fMet)-specific endonuclease VapC